VDAINSKIYWVDAFRDTIETANFEGLHRSVVMRNSHTYFYDIVLYKVLLNLESTILVCTLLS